MQARLIKGIQKPRPEFETVGACLIMLHGISDAGANFECWYVEFLGHQEQHLEFIDAAAAHMSAYDDNPRAQARARQGDILVVVEPQTTENSKNAILQVAPVFAYLY